MPTSNFKFDPRMSRMTWSADGWSAQLGGTVSYPGNETAALALAAQDAPTGGGLFVNAFHPQNAIMRCKSVDCDFGINIATITAKFQQTDSEFPDKSDPLKTKPKWRFRGGNERFPADTDLNGFALVNSAGTPFSNTTRNYRTRFLSITVMAPLFDMGIDIRYANTCNSKPWNPLGLGTLDIGQVMCLGIAPTGEVTPGGEYVEVVFDFELRAGLNQVIFPTTAALPTAVTCWDGFQYVFIDQGSRGWYTATDTLPGDFVNNKGEKVGEVLLDGTGKPILTALKVSTGAAAPASTVATPVGSQTSGILRSATTPTAKFLTFRQTDFQDFTEFGFDPPAPP